MFLLIRFVTLLILLLAVSPAAAHVEAAPRAGLTDWSWEPSILASIAVAAGWYAVGVGRLHHRLEVRRLVGLREIGAYGAGLATLFIALVSPIDTIADQLFWIHMIQHLLLLLLAAPMLVLGRPALAFLWAFGPTGRKRVGRASTRLGLPSGINGLMHPIVVWPLFCGVFVLWHFPGPYQWALRDETIHTLEHLSFLITSLMFWSIVIEPSGRRRLEFGPTLVFVTTAAVLSGLPGALISLAPRPLYAAHASGEAAWGLSPLEDQQLAGLVMWIPGGFIYLAAVAFVFLQWLQQGDARRTVQTRRVILHTFLCCALPLLFSACGDDQPQRAPTDEVERGATLIRSYGCGSCHTVPGIEDANGVVGPPLIQIGRRIYIAGILRNTPDNMIAWLRDPQRFVPGNAMPDMGMSERDAREVAAYLSTLR